ncbi:hypothetical protein MBLNU230_g0337t1 [Neophaeotheca triangularis]
MQQLSRLVAILACGSVAFTSPTSSLAPRAHVFNETASLKPLYDYVIVGGGTSGLTVANRLSEDPDISVLVLEYGHVAEPEEATLIPGIPVPDKYSRNYESVRQAELNGRTSPVLSGAVVGGGTVVNGMFFTRGSAGDYDAWERLGNPGWGWEGLLPYFKKSETFTPPCPELAERFPGLFPEDLSAHGTEGPVGSGFANYQYPALDFFYRAWNSIGLANQSNPQAGNANGALYSPLHYNAANQSRSSAADAHYRFVGGLRDNYHIVTGSAVSKIKFDENKVATSVEYISRETNETSTASACREVLLAAGVISPQILQLSGVGPVSLLESLKIPVVEALEGVGRNFQDQPSMYMGFEFRSENYPFPTPDWVETNGSWLAEQVEIYNANRTGPMTLPYYSGSTAAFLALSDVTTNRTEFERIINDVHSFDVATLLADEIDESILAGYKAQAKLIAELYKSPNATVQEVVWSGADYVPIAMLKPLSCGTVMINSTDIRDPPLFDYGTFTHPTDLDIAILALKRTRAWAASAPMQTLGVTESLPGANITSDTDIQSAIRGFASGTWQHQTSGNSMLPRELGGVVDPQLRVYGVRGLRVVDASVMPLVPGSHTSSTVYAVAEKAADVIKAAQE